MDLQNRILDIAYSTVGLAPVNTVAHYRLAAKCGFPALKGDIRPTSDGGLVMCHDEGFTRDAQGRVIRFNGNDQTKILDMRFADCLKLKHGGEQPEPIASYEDFVRVCAETGKICFTTIRDEQIPQATAEMFRIVRKYNMEDRLIVNSFTYEALQETRKYSASVPVSFVQPPMEVLKKETVDQTVALGNGIVCLFSFCGGASFAYIAESMPSIEYAKSNGVLLYEAIVGKKEDREKALRYGITGFQIASVFAPYACEK